MQVELMLPDDVSSVYLKGMKLYAKELGRSLCYILC